MIGQCDTFAGGHFLVAYLRAPMPKNGRYVRQRDIASELSDPVVKIDLRDSNHVIWRVS
jgi:hypothetical protein